MQGMSGAGTSPRTPLIYVGTSGWTYDWNPDGFEWYVNFSGLNAVELNASFYRFPPDRVVSKWARLSRGRIRWAIKVHNSITHRYMLGAKALQIWHKFVELFKPLDEQTDFFLLQLPPWYKPTPRLVDRLEKFVREVNLGWKLAVEWRHVEWFKDEWVRWASKLEFTVVSIDSPIGLFYVRSGPYIYVRFHGRTSWYSYRYSIDELKMAAQKLLELMGEAIYIFFNNNHDMLDNARQMLSILLKSVGG